MSFTRTQHALFAGAGLVALVWADTAAAHDSRIYGSLQAAAVQQVAQESCEQFALPQHPGGKSARLVVGQTSSAPPMITCSPGSGRQDGAASPGKIAAERGQGILESHTACEAEKSTMLDEVIVTANKREERLHDVALSVTAVTGEALERRQELTIADIAAQVPGLAVQRTSPIYNRLIIRGQNSGSSGATVAVVVDDVPFTFSGSTANGAFTIADLDPYDLARIEVLRGPQGTLYGAGAEGGIVKYVTNQPTSAAFGAAAEVGVQSITHGETGYSARGWTNLPLGDKAAVRVSATYEDIPGYIDNPLRNETDSNHGYRYSARLSLRLAPSDNVVVRASTFLQRLRTEGNFVADAVGAPNAANPPANQTTLINGLSFGSYLNPLLNTDLTNSYVSVDWDMGWARLTSVTSYGVMKFRFNDDLTGNPIAPGLSYGDYLGGAVYRRPVALDFVNYNSLNKYNQELRLTSPDGFEFAGLPVQWQGGLFGTREVSTVVQQYRALARSDLATVLAPALGAISGPSAYNELSGFGEVKVHFTPRFDVSLGGRITNVRQHAQVSYAPGLVTTPTATTLPETRSEESSTTFSFAPRYQFSDATMVYGRIASGFRPGGPQLLIPGAPADFPQSYTSDSTVNYEVGIRTYQFDRKLSIDVAAYYIDWQDIQIRSRFVSQTNGVPYTVTGNAGSAISKGVEWDIALRPVKGLTLQWLGGRVDAHLTKDAPALGAFHGYKLPNVPDLTSTLNADYEWPVLDDWRAYVGATWSHTGQQYTTFSAAALYVAHIPLPAFDTFALRAGIANSRWSLDAYARNLTDEDAITGYTSANAIGPRGIANVIQPRTVGLRLGVKY